MFTLEDHKWMRRALELASHVDEPTSPNPMVGAVVVKDGAALAVGRHLGPGRPHAEVEALDAAGEAAAGATLYVSLEPCCHFGRTGPCVDRIIAAGIRRVVAAMQDPNPKVCGKGIAALREHGIEVASGLMRREATLLNRAFVTWITQRRPYVHLKLAQSLDGNAATHTGESRWITSERARSDAQNLRARVDAIVVGVGTVLADNPRLTARPAGRKERYPLRVILDSRCRTPVGAACIGQPGSTLIAATREAPADRRSRLEQAGAEVWIDPSGSPRVDIAALLTHLAEREVTSLLVEGGPQVAGSFLDAGLVDEVHAYLAPMVIGGANALRSVAGRGAARLSDAVRFVDSSWQALGDECRFTGRVPRAHLDEEAS